MNKQNDRIITEQDGENQKPAWREILDYILTLAAVAAAVLLLNRYVLINAKIPSESMQDTIMMGDQIFGNRLAYVKKDPQRYDIIIFVYPDDNNDPTIPARKKTLFIKRVIGLPGETVTIDNGHVYIGDSLEPLDESFLPEPPAQDLKKYVFDVPEGHYLVLGDNRNHSRDSRFWKDPYVSEEEILGEAVFRYWPVTRMSALGNDVREGT